MNVQRVSKTSIDKSFLERTIQDADIEREDLPDNLTEALIVYIARVSSSRTNKWDEHHKLINFLIREGHWSPFEHAYVTYEIETSRAIGRQLLRHRSFTFQEFSQRYAEVMEIEDIEFREQPEHNRQSSEDVLSTVSEYGNRINENLGVLNAAQANGAEDAALALQEIKQAYQKLVDAGVATETARMILPGATTTTIYMTGSLRSWIHFLDLREDDASQKEIREIAKPIREDMNTLFPHVGTASGW